MFKLFNKYFLIYFFLFTSIPSHSQSFFRTSGTDILDASGKPIILRGMGLGGWMLQEGYMLGIYKEGQQYRIRERIDSLIGTKKTDEFYDLWLANHTTRADIDSLKAWGFNSVRLPMHYDLYTLPIEKEKIPGKNTWIEKGFSLTDSLISWCKDAGIGLTLDLHAAPGGQGNDLNISDRNPKLPSLWESIDNQNKTIALWQKIAERYADEPTIIAYDIINEPNWGFEDPVNDRNGLKEKTNAPLLSLMQQITKAIRSVDTNHIIVIEGNGWGNNYSGILNDGLWDKNIVLSYHKYWNYNDEASIAQMIDTRKKYNVPIWLGETGENSNVWFADAVRLLESHNIGWAWWPLKKRGINNPFQIRTDSTYEKLVKYWNNQKVQLPPSEEIYRSLINFARSTNASKNIVHRDVIDALIRQPSNDATLPFRKHLITRGTKISAIDYDLGKNGFAYLDNDLANYRVSGKEGKGNHGGVYRNDGVDIYEEKGSYYIGKFETGEWMQYTATVEQSGTYELKILVSAKSPGSFITISDSKKTFAITKAIPQTGTGKSWDAVSFGKIPLTKGQLQFRVMADKGEFKVKEIVFE